MDWTLVFPIILIILLVYDIYLRHKAGKEITVPGILEAVAEIRPVALEVKDIVQVAVNAVEQARREGKITDNNVAFRNAYNMAKKWIPDEWEVPDDELVEYINGAVLVASSLSRQAGVSSENVTRIS